MKLKCEIKDENFLYEYEIGSTKQQGTMPISADNLVRFTSILQLCQGHANWEEKQWSKEVLGREWARKIEEERKLEEKK